MLESKQPTKAEAHLQGLLEALVANPENFKRVQMAASNAGVSLRSMLVDEAVTIESGS